MQTAVNTSHQYIGWTAGLIDCQHPAYPFTINQCAVQMNKRSLRHSRKCFMCTLYHNISPQGNRTFRKIVRKIKMCTMCFIYNNRHMMFMCNLTNRLNIRYDPIISRGSNHNCLDIRMSYPHFFNILWINSFIYSIFCINWWINIIWFQMMELNSMINCFMAISGRQNLSAITAYSRNRRQEPRCTTINNKHSFFRMV